MWITGGRRLGRKNCAPAFHAGVAMGIVIYLVKNFGHAFWWPAVYCAAVVAIMLGLLVMAQCVALFTADKERAKRASEIFFGLLRFFSSRRPR